MKLLFDQNLSPRLVNKLADIYPDSSHVYLLGLDSATDAEVWRYARENEFVIVTKDADFGEISTLRGYPPRVIWLRIGNCTTAKIEEMLRSGNDLIERLQTDPTLGIVSLY
jgi:predicted nuclease of predicted toxin-antitoxin system